MAVAMDPLAPRVDAVGVQLLRREGRRRRRRAPLLSLVDRGPAGGRVPAASDAGAGPGDGSAQKPVFPDLLRERRARLPIVLPALRERAILAEHLDGARVVRRDDDVAVVVGRASDKGGGLLGLLDMRCRCRRRRRL